AFMSFLDVRVTGVSQMSPPLQPLRVVVGRSTPPADSAAKVHERSVESHIEILVTQVNEEDALITEFAAEDGLNSANEAAPSATLDDQPGRLGWASLVNFLFVFSVPLVWAYWRCRSVRASQPTSEWSSLAWKTARTS